MRKMGSNERDLWYQLAQLTLGYWRSQTLFAANELGVFAALRDGALNAKEVAQRLASAPEHTERLLNACVTVGLLSKEDGRFRNEPISELLLVPESPRSMSNWVRFMADCYRPWGRLARAVRTGKSAENGFSNLERGGDYTRDLVLAMHEHAMGPGRETVSHLDLGTRRRLLDVGGGAGSHSILLAEKHPDLEAVVLDLPPVLEITRDLIAQHGLESRVGVRAANYLTDDLGTGYDVALLSNVLHQEDPRRCVELLERVRRALVDGGLLVVQLSFLNADKDGPPWAVLQSLQLLLLYPGGRAYSLEEMLQMVSAAGFQNPRAKTPSLLASESLILATKE